MQAPIDGKLESSEATCNQETAEKTSANLESLRKMHILVVDDIQDNLDLAVTMLSKSKFSNISTALSGKIALQFLRENFKDRDNRVDVVLLDVMMPEMNGYEVCKAIKQNNDFQAIPIIMITANAMWRDEIAFSAFDAGATDIMFKPMRRAILMPRVIASLSLKKERDLRLQRERELEDELAERRVIEARLQYLVTHDDLTGLSNRRFLNQAIENAVKDAKEKELCSALCYLDLDQFKIINDVEGHNAGDQMLISISNLLRSNIRKNDILARISSDEFAIVFTHTDKETVLDLAENIRKELETFNFTFEGKFYHISVSLGITMITPNGEFSASEILAQADQACFSAKSFGRNMVREFTEEGSEFQIIKKAATWVPKIREAIKEDLFCLLYQPVFDLKLGKATHFEALIRMKDRQDKTKLVTPFHFIPVAEQMGLIHEIDLWVIRSAFEKISQMTGEYGNISLNINLSGHAFQDPVLLPFVENQLKKTGIDAARVTFEITETAAIENIDKTREMIEALRSLGCRFALDDFGAGFNSFSYIKNFPVDFLKIDGSFITRLASDTVDQALVKSMVEIATTLDKKTVAEFVEDAEIMKKLIEYGVDYAQGYFIGKPEAQFKVDDAIRTFYK